MWWKYCVSLLRNNQWFFVNTLSWIQSWLRPETSIYPLPDTRVPHPYWPWYQFQRYYKSSRHTHIWNFLLSLIPLGQRYAKKQSFGNYLLSYWPHMDHMDLFRNKFPPSFWAYCKTALRCATFYKETQLVWNISWSLFALMWSNIFYTILDPPWPIVLLVYHESASTRTRHFCVQKSVINVSHFYVPVIMYIYYSCDKDTVSVHCRRRTIDIIVTVTGSLLDNNINVYFLDIPVSLLYDE